MKTYKGFKKDMTCRGFQYEEGKEYTHDGKVKACDEGFHACEAPIDCFKYYAPSESVYHEVEQSGEISKGEDDTKVASSVIKIGSRIDVLGIVKAQFEYVKAHKDFIIYPEGHAVIDTGVHMAIPEGYVGFLKSKSGLNVKHHLTGEGVIDSGYTGSIVVKLYHNGHLHNSAKTFKRGDKIIQIVLLPIIKPEIEIIDEIEETERGDGGFGSTGR